MLLLATSIAFSCKKTDDLGDDIVIFPNDNMNLLFTDTTTISAYSVLVDSLTGSNLKQTVLGSYHDAVFGTSTASFYTQLALPADNIDLGDNVVCDSVFFTIGYTGYYGDSLEYHTIRVFELLEDISDDSTYYSNHPARQIDPIAIGIHNTQFNRWDSVPYDGDMLVPHLKIPLSNSFGQKICDKSAQTELSSTEDFQEFMKGVYVTVDKTINTGGFAYLSLTAAITEIRIYYHNSEDTSEFYMPITSSCANSSIFEHYGYQDASSEVRQQLVDGDSTLGDEYLYIQSMAGAKTKFKFPNIRNMNNGGKIAIQNAELVLYVDGNSDEFDEPISTLYLVKLDSNGVQKYTSDYSESSSYYGGTYDSSTRSYRFNMNKHVQALANGDEEDYGMELIASGASIYANRLVLGGPKSADRKMRLRITYIKL